MSRRRNRCPICVSFDLEVVVVHNPDTTDMNADATLKCKACQHTWEGSVTSAYHAKMRRLGRRR